MGIIPGGVEMKGVKTSMRNSVHASVYPLKHECARSAMSTKRTPAQMYLHTLSTITTKQVALSAAGAVLINDTVDPSLIAHVTVRQNPADDNSAEVSVWDSSVRHAHPHYATTPDGEVVPFRQPRTPSDRDIERYREFAPARTPPSTK